MSPLQLRNHGVFDAIARKTMTSSAIAANVQHVRQRIEKAYETAPAGSRHVSLPRLVAVSKTKPIEMIVEAYEKAGHRYFGENYIQELSQKAKSAIIRERCPEIRWVFIGNIQSNKVNRLLRVRNLHAVETITSEKLAGRMNVRWKRKMAGEKMKSSSGSEDLDAESAEPLERLRVFVQVNTSGEDSKSGLQPADAIQCAEYIRRECDALQFVGFMTIGALAHSLDVSLNTSSDSENPDFVCLRRVRDYLRRMAQMDVGEVELSMGMSADFEAAIAAGSSNVRVGSTIFGERVAKK